MKVTLAKGSGFCFGVKRALEITLQTIQQEKANIFCLGPLIHNHQVVEDLHKKGLNIINSLNEAPQTGILIVRSHGLLPATINEAKQRGFKIVDATCSFVKKAQELAQLLAKENYQVLIVGDPAHPEVKGLMGYAGEEAIAIGELKDLEKLKNKTKIGIVVQTTQTYDFLNLIVSALLNGTKECRIFNTICSATMIRQRATRELARKVKLMLVVGSKQSANTTRLSDICEEEGTTTYHIETPDEIKEEWFNGLTEIGVTAGASTPDWIIKPVIEKCEKIV